MRRIPKRIGWLILLVLLPASLAAGCMQAGPPPLVHEDCPLCIAAPGGGVSCSATGAAYFENHTPLEFLDELRRHPDSIVTVRDAPDGWITREDAATLMGRIDSEEPAAPVVSLLSSYMPFNQTSTVGNEAMFLLEGYRQGRYPPALCSLHYFHPNRTGMREWWDSIKI